MDQFYVCQSFQEFVSDCQVMDSMTQADLSGMDRERGTSPVGHDGPQKYLCDPLWSPVHHQCTVQIVVKHFKSMSAAAGIRSVPIQPAKPQKRKVAKPKHCKATRQC